jgi:hypothetical protein
MSDFTTPRVSEKKFYSIPDSALIADGTSTGLATIESTFQYKVGMVISLSSTTQASKRFKIKRVISKTEMILGEEKTPITQYSDISAFLVVDTAIVHFVEQQRPVIDINEINRQVYEEEPTVALRNHLVDWLGRSYSKTNPVPVELTDGSISIGTVNAELEVQLSHKDGDPDSGDVADSVQVGDEATIAKVDPKNRSWSMNRYEKLLGILANANWMKLGDFDQVVPTFTEDNAVLAYMQNNVVIGEAFFRFVSDTDWDIKLRKYINNANGDKLLDDDGEPLLLD